jgi:hypothetical protein
MSAVNIVWRRLLLYDIGGLSYSPTPNRELSCLANYLSYNNGSIGLSLDAQCIAGHWKRELLEM